MNDTSYKCCMGHDSRTLSTHDVVTQIGTLCTRKIYALSQCKQCKDIEWFHDGHIVSRPSF